MLFLLPQRGCKAATSESPNFSLPYSLPFPLLFRFHSNPKDKAPRTTTSKSTLLYMARMQSSNKNIINYIVCPLGMRILQGGDPMSSRLFSQYTKCSRPRDGSPTYPRLDYTDDPQPSYTASPQTSYPSAAEETHQTQKFNYPYICPLPILQYDFQPYLRSRSPYYNPLSGPSPENPLSSGCCRQLLREGRGTAGSCERAFAEGASCRYTQICERG